MKFIYLASPYSHHDMDIMEWRFSRACKTTAVLMEQGNAVFSPIAHSHPLAAHMPPELRTDFNFWMKMDLPILRFADELQVLMLPKWEASKGVARETAYAQAIGIPVHYIHDGDY